ncbi:hypothetical protein [Halobacillus sp. Marseille-P3879]|uniref:hypothetical protein n=1 Tax=Halobacillus sp. Marseille-P3879 TaxID=2045014 RepID=UPI000C7BF1B7|nr:hypothetical protein [Halobacillus sp. Marseille-P3879]
MSKEKRGKVSDAKLHYLIAVAALVSWLLHFAANLDFYDREKLYSGITFICIAVPLYAACVFLYHYFNNNHT